MKWLSLYLPEKRGKLYLSFQGVHNGNVPLNSETDDEPNAEEAADIGEVDHSLAPARGMHDKHSHIVQPDEQ